MSEELANILQFPKSKIVREQVPNIEELNKLKEKGIQKFADALVEEITDNILHELNGCGIDIESDVFIKDFYFVNLIMSAAIYRSLDIEHSMHDYIDKHVKVIDKNPDEEET